MAKNLQMKSARVLQDMSQEELARAVGVTRQTISYIENGEYNPTLNLCRKICSVLNKSLEELFGEKVKWGAQKCTPYFCLVLSLKMR